MSQSILRFSKVKASFNGESRRFDLVNLHEGASAFAKLSLYCTHVFGVGLFAIKYTDEDGDLITISSDEELSEGLSWAQGVGKTCLSLVLVATPSPKAQKKDVVQARPCTFPRPHALPPTSRISTFANHAVFVSFVTCAL